MKTLRLKDYSDIIVNKLGISEKSAKSMLTEIEKEIINTLLELNEFQILGVVKLKAGYTNGANKYHIKIGRSVSLPKRKKLVATVSKMINKRLRE